MRKGHNWKLRIKSNIIFQWGIDLSLFLDDWFWQRRWRTSLGKLPSLQRGLEIWRWYYFLFRSIVWFLTPIGASVGGCRTKWGGGKQNYLEKTTNYIKTEEWQMSFHTSLVPPEYDCGSGSGDCQSRGGGGGGVMQSLKSVCLGKYCWWLEELLFWCCLMLKCSVLQFLACLCKLE